MLECKPGESIRAVKNVTVNEPFFTGHFPGRPVMPGVMMLEALAQAAGILAYATLGKVPNANTRFYFAGIDGCRFRRPVEPGDQLILTARVLRNMKGIWKLATAAYVGDAEAAQAEMMLFADADNASPHRIDLKRKAPEPVSIDSRAVVSPQAEIAADVQIGPFAVIGPGVSIGAGCWIGPHVVINGPTVLGEGNRVYQFASLGEAPQDMKYRGEPTRLVIGERNTFREYVTVNRGTVGRQG